MHVKNTKRKYRKWKNLSEEETERIVDAFNTGVKKNEIMRRHEIPEGQLCRVIIDDANKKNK